MSNEENLNDLLNLDDEKVTNKIKRENNFLDIVNIFVSYFNSKKILKYISIILISTLVLSLIVLLIVQIIVISKTSRYDAEWYTKIGFVIKDILFISIFVLSAIFYHLKKIITTNDETFSSFNLFSTIFTLIGQFFFLYFLFISLIGTFLLIIDYYGAKDLFEDYSIIKYPEVIFIRTGSGFWTGVLFFLTHLVLAAFIKIFYSFISDLLEMLGNVYAYTKKRLNATDIQADSF